jgi:hypothetical protein
MNARPLGTSATEYLVTRYGPGEPVPISRLSRYLCVLLKYRKIKVSCSVSPRHRGGRIGAVCSIKYPSSSGKGNVLAVSDQCGGTPHGSKAPIAAVVC